MFPNHVFLQTMIKIMNKKKKTEMAARIFVDKMKRFSLKEDSTENDLEAF